MRARSAGTGTPWRARIPTRTFTPWRRCFWEKSARLSPARSHSVRRELAAAVALTGGDEHLYPRMVTHSTGACGRSSAVGQGTNEAPELMS